MSLQLSLIVRNESEMKMSAAVFADHSHAPLGIGLRGDLGSGKTVFCRAYIHACGHNGTVRSPTYTLVETYQGRRFVIHHFDFYRLDKEDDLEAMGGRDYDNADSVCLFEWCNRLPAVRLDLTVAIDVLEARRRLNVEAHNERGESLIRDALDRLALIAAPLSPDNGSQSLNTIVDA